jgi:hypothetical protein
MAADPFYRSVSGFMLLSGLSMSNVGMFKLQSYERLTAQPKYISVSSAGVLKMSLQTREIKAMERDVV